MIKKSIFIILYTITTLQSTIMAMEDSFMESVVGEDGPPRKREFSAIVPNPCPAKTARTTKKEIPITPLDAEEVVVEFLEPSVPDVTRIPVLLRHIHELNETIKKQLETLPTDIATQLLEILPRQIETPRKTAILAIFTHHPESLLPKDTEILILHLQRDEYRLIKNLELIALSQKALSDTGVFEV